MTPEDVKKLYGSNYRFAKETGMSPSTLANWLQWGRVPEDAQYKLERITNGKLRVEKVDVRSEENMSDVRVIWPLVVTDWEKIYLNYIDLGNYTMFRMAIFKTRIPRVGLYVSIEDRGSFFFAMEKALHKDYVAEKLYLQGDHGQVADFLNAQLNHPREQQGHYYENVINAIEPYGKIGEEKIMPWHPELEQEDVNGDI